MGSIIAVATEKGGATKSTLALHLAWRQAKEGKALLVDLDSQANSTRVLLKNRLPESGHIGHALLRHISAREAIIPGAGGVDLLPSHPELAGALQLLSGELGPERRLGQVLATVTPDYSMVILDCAPGRSTMFIGALLASNKVVAPVVPDLFGAYGLAGLLELLNAVKRDLGSGGEFAGAILSRVGRTKMAGEIVSQLGRELGPKLLGAIPESVKVGEALAASLPVWEHAPGSPVAEALWTACGAVLDATKEARHAA